MYGCDRWGALFTYMCIVIIMAIWSVTMIFFFRICTDISIFLTLFTWTASFGTTGCRSRRGVWSTARGFEFSFFTWDRSCAWWTAQWRLRFLLGIYMYTEKGLKFVKKKQIKWYAYARFLWVFSQIDRFFRSSLFSSFVFFMTCFLDACC